ncbi:MAG TPA: 4Fe-4S dicluster domain-containing protein [Vicinamibacterales bacterium]|nr:4Fe-4S dicluster domain-containing protein [Vicinamibacterales bacterium]
MITAFLTDSTLCIGCKACEVACKEWNGVPADGFNFTGTSYDNTGGLGHSTWRHVKFVERAVDLAVTGHADAGYRSNVFRWDFSSDVCKHCENAGCLEACPTGSIVRTEFGGVFIQPDICNGCGYCVVTCPFGVVDRRPDDGRAFKCTFCYDRQKVGLQPACATACPTQSIQFGEIETLRARAVARVEELRARGIADALVYDPRETSVGGTHAIFVFRGQPEEYNLPSAPEVPTVHLMPAWRSAAVAAGLMAAGAVLAFLSGSASDDRQDRAAAGQHSASRSWG